MLADSDIKKYEAALLELRDKVDEQLEAMRSWCEPVAGSEALGRLTRNNAMQDQQLALHQRERLVAQQTRIRTALKRIEDGAYGVCMSCKTPLDGRRLDAAPDSPLCVSCIEKWHARRAK